MNFDTDDDTDFSLSPQQNSSNNKLASLFKLSNETTSQTNESLKYKAPKQPQAQKPAAAQSTNQQQQMIFFSHVQAFKYLNNRYEPQGKLGLVIISSQNTYKIVLYVDKTQPTAMIKISSEFKIALQKNNYSSFYDESRQLWSILFDTEETIIAFATQIALCKCNLSGNIETSNINQDLKVNTETDVPQVEPGDSIEIETLVTLCKDNKLSDVIENTQQKPFKLRLGKNKLPKRVEDLILNMKQGERKLFCLTGNSIKKNDNRKERSNSFLNDQMSLPQLSTNEPDSPRSRAESVRDKTKIINDQLNDPKLDKAKLISRMARMGQPMLPQTSAQSGGVIYGVEDEDWEQQQQQQLMQETANKTAYLMQQQQQQQFLQQQMAYQNQLIQANQMNQQPIGNQLALFKSPTAVQSPQLLIYPQQQQQNVPQQVEQHKSDSSILTKLELITDKIDSLKKITQLNNQNMPSMETNILLQNLQRIVRENEQYKKDLYDKSAKIEEQNAKITDLLMKAQNYVEQNHQILELKNTAFQTNAEKTVNKVLELEQDKMRLTGDLSKLTAQISELNLEINKMQKNEAEIKQQLVEVSKNTDSHKQQSERLLIENADLQTKLDTISAEYKKERQLRKSLETKMNLNDEELNELRTSLASNQRGNDEKKRKYEMDKAQLDREIDDLKLVHTKEINELKDRLNQFKTKGSELQSEQIKQVEFDLNREWQAKLDKTILQTEQKYERQLNALNEEKHNLDAQVTESKEVIKTLRANLARFDADIESLKQKLDDSNLIKEKFERLQSKALQMKETYDARIKELLDADPDPEIIAEELKKVMNLIFRQLKRQIKSEEYYAGNGILSAMLKIIKMYTLRILQPNDDENVDEDYFSQHIYKAPEPTIIIQQQSPLKFEHEISQPVQVISESYSPQSKAYDQVDQPITRSTEIEPIKLNETINTMKQSNENAFTKLINSNDDEDEDDDDHSIQLINDDEEEQAEIKLDTVAVLNKIEENNNQLNEENNEEDIPDPSDYKIETDGEDKSDESDDSEKAIVNDEKETDEFDVYDKKISVESISQISPLQEEMIERLEEEEPGVIKEEDQVEDSVPTETTANVDVVKSVKLTKGLFDDDDEEDDDNSKLFSFTATKETNDLTTSGLKTDKEQPNPANTPVNAAAATTTPVNLKFSPPPLFENDEDSNEKDIDWFK